MVVVVVVVVVGAIPRERNANVHTMRTEKEASMDRNPLVRNTGLTCYTNTLSPSSSSGAGTMTITTDHGLKFWDELRL